MQECDNYIESKGVRRGQWFGCGAGGIETGLGGELFVYMCSDVPIQCYYTVANINFQFMLRPRGT